MGKKGAKTGKKPAAKASPKPAAPKPTAVAKGGRNSKTNAHAPEQAQGAGVFEVTEPLKKEAKAAAMKAMPSIFGNDKLTKEMSYGQQTELLKTLREYQAKQRDAQRDKIDAAKEKVVKIQNTEEKKSRKKKKLKAMKRQLAKQALAKWKKKQAKKMAAPPVKAAPARKSEPKANPKETAARAV